MGECCKGNSSLEPNSNLSRRDFFSRVGDGLYGAALASLFEADLFSSKPALAAAPEVFTDLRPRPPHFPAKAKAVIQLFMHGGPSQVDLLDPSRYWKNTQGSLPLVIWRMTFCLLAMPAA
jgi:hypothetical protein